MCTIEAALMAGSAAVSFANQASATNSYNSSALANAQNASIAATNKYNDEQRKYVYDATATQKEGYAAAIKGRQSVASGVASSADSGMDASSISLQNLIANEQQITAENLSKVRLKQDDLRDSYVTRGKGIEAEAQGRILSMPMKEGPNPLGLAINLASAGASGYSSNPNMNAADIWKWRK